MRSRGRCWAQGSLQARLLALVLLPLLAVGGMTLSSVLSRSTAAEAAGKAEHAVRLAGELSAARSGIVQEVVPSFSLVLVEDNALAAEFGVDGSSRQLLRASTPAQISTARAAADAALDALAADPRGRQLAARARAAVGALRAATAAGSTDLSSLYRGYTDIATTLTRAETKAVAAAIAEGLEPAAVRAVTDLQQVSSLTQAGKSQLPMFLGTRLAASGSVETDRVDWLMQWGIYRGVAMLMPTVHSPELRNAWAVALHDASVRAMEEVIDKAAAAAEDASKLSMDQLLEFSSNNMARDKVLDGLLRVAVDQAVDATAQQRMHALSELRWLLAVGVGLLVLALVLVLVVARSVTKPLQRLAEDATRVSEGRLEDIDESGPREVRTVARALAATVASLRRVQGQAEAVATGELDSPLLHEPLPGPLGRVVHASVERITTAMRQREELQSDLAFQAAHDPLTALPNRAQALRLIDGALQRSKRAGTSVGLLFVDLDHFKKVNDTFGHAAGDEVLRVVAQRMEALVRAGDVVCRLGGDEFVVLLEPVSAESALLELAQRLISSLSAPIPAAGRLVSVGASVGVTVSRDDSADGGHLLNEADAAAYRAKTSGRGVAEVFDETLRADLAERADIERAMTHGLARGEFVLHYQPVVDVATQQLRGFEALMRWERPGRGLVPPGEFIPTAEKSTLISQLGRWALLEATRQLAAWSAAASGPEGMSDRVTMAVNISGRHLASPDIVDDVQAALEASGIAPSRLVLELTETVLVNDPIASERLARLRRIGVRIAIDDFGTGYTSIGQLQRLAVDTLKIDRSFVSSDEPGNRELVRLIVSAAHTFNLAVVAEGVEQVEQLSALKELNCDSAQGFLISRPLPSSAFDGEGATATSAA
jgi:diguanylate cyclase (GGDEF)-like protein